MTFDGADTATMTRVGNRVDAWNDISGNGYSLVTGFAGEGFNPDYNAALFGGAGGIRWDGNDFLEEAGASVPMDWHGWTILVVGQLKGAGNSYAYAADGNGNALGVQAIGTRFGLSLVAGTKEGIPLSQSCVFGSRWNGTTWHAIQNAELFPVYNGTYTGPAAATTFGKLQFGGSQPGGSCNMDIRAVYIYNRSLSEDELVRMTRYLQGLYGFSALPDPTWNIVVDSNSMGFGIASGGGNWTMDVGIRQANGGPGPRDYINLSYNGITTEDLAARAAATVDPYYDSSFAAERRILIFWELTNSLRGLGVVAADVYATAKAYCQARKAVGWKVIIGTCLPRNEAGTNPTFEADRIWVNAQIVANAVSEGWADQVADIGGDAVIGAPGACDGSKFESDHIHLNEAGHAIAKAYITAAINAITGY